MRRALPGHRMRTTLTPRKPPPRIPLGSMFQSRTSRAIALALAATAVLAPGAVAAGQSTGGAVAALDPTEVRRHGLAYQGIGR